ncbi:unnamed protein product [Linum tenue]|uniref:TIR domain-containing protein n=1 Tax=Linum tenue TaxID=586396 RepID=A0AAV0KGN1_9ROSI|nr:unnamed protein product [Linum tenue]
MEWNRSDPSSEPDSSSSDSTTRPRPALKYEVFLSFRGPDVRTTFADSLYHFLVHSKIRTFYDDEELRKGDKIAPSLVQAIQESKIYIPILSQGYASSKWCLEELSLMVESLNRNQGHILLPVFYFVEPRDVRRQERSYYSRAFLQHSRKYDAETTKEWKEALQFVGQLKGWHVTESDRQGAVIDNIFSQVWSHLMGSYKIETDELIGIESRVKEVRDLLDLDGERLKMVGIHGMGGIGKTTISKAVYNEVSSRFERSCFLEDIRETLLKNDGVVTLQNKIISSILRHDSRVGDTSEGIHIIRDKVCKYKVFIVLDDVDERFEFEKILGKLQDYFFGSRFIVTTRDKRVLEFLEGCTLFEAKLMSHNDSFKLFGKHAFRMDDPPEENADLCEEFVKIAAGLPLALKVIGSFLFRKEKRIWREKLEELKERPFSNGVHEILKISYNDLTSTEKEIFLDIACFFIGKSKELPFYMWTDCKFYPESGVNNLIFKSLIKVNESNEFEMHDLIKDLGRAIVQAENIQQPWKRSRIWSNDEALDMLENGQGNDKVEALRIDMGDRDVRKLTEEGFRKLSGVRFLQVRHCNMTGDFSKMLPNTLWLQLRFCRSIPDDVNLKKVAILDLKGSYLRDDWRGWQRAKEGKKLKVVNLEGCSGLVKAPDLSSCRGLEVINVEGCYYMGGELHIGNFKNLKRLSLLGSKISALKGDIGMLQDLTEIDAPNLKEFPAGIGDLRSLEILRVTPADAPISVPAFPTSLKQLTISTPRFPNLLELKDLEELCLERCAPEIPGDIWLHLTKLKILTVSFFRGKSLLMQVEQSTAESTLPSSLNSLALSCCFELETLPNLVNLSNLTQLRLELVLVDEIRGLGELGMLETLQVSSAQNLKSLDGLQNLVLLQQLTVEHCGALEKLPCIANLTKLNTLVIRSCRILFEIQGPDASMGGSSLTRLEISRCPKLANVEGLIQPLNMKKLYVHGSRPGDDLDTTFVPSVQIMDLSGLVNLQVMNISGCQQLAGITGFYALQWLEVLNISHCNSIRKLWNLSGLKSLKKLTICDATQLTEMEELDRLESLEWLQMDGCTSILKLPNLCGLTSLTTLEIKGFTQLSEVTRLERLESLVRLKLIDCGLVVRLPDLSELKNLKVLIIRGCTQLMEITGLESLESLQVLAMSSCESIYELPDLSHLEHLRYLNISGCMQLTQVMGVERLGSLEVLAMSQCKSIIELPDLSALKNMTHLDIRECSQLIGIIGLHKLQCTILGVHDPAFISYWKTHEMYLNM